MSAFFVTATGTDIGKTFVTAGLVRLLRAQGHAVSALKPIVSGFDMASASGSDPGVLLDALGEPITPQTLARMSPWRFAAPLSPDMAAAREGRAVAFDAVVEFCQRALGENEDTLFIEGVGGVMVPLDADHTVLDWMAALRIPLILVSGTYLGTISHTLTALYALRDRRLAVAAIVLNDSGSDIPIAETAASIARFAAGIPIVFLSRAGHGGNTDELSRLWNAIR
jgi:dethiobiotin synthetase